MIKSDDCPLCGETMTTSKAGNRECADCSYLESASLNTGLLDAVLLDVRDEVERAESRFDPYNSHHEAYAVILEELDEYWDEVRRKESERDHLAMRKELIQVAATAVRALLGLA